MSRVIVTGNLVPNSQAIHSHHTGQYILCDIHIEKLLQAVV